jgi:LuxR family transcriptional regulator, quorum-sensing system regulator BjaR1
MLTRVSTFINSARTVGTVRELESLLIEECKIFGVDSAASLLIGKIGQPLSFGRIVGPMKHNWSERYRFEGFIRKDIAARRAILSVTPFSWRECAAEAANDRDANLIFEAARDHGLFNGYVVPIHCGDGSLAVVTFCGEQLADDPNSRSYMHLLAIYYHTAVERLALAKLANENPLITARQVECLRWVSVGKTDWEIGQILGLSEATINRHIERAKERLGVRTRVQAVVAILTQGTMVG